MKFYLFNYKIDNLNKNKSFYTTDGNCTNTNTTSY